MNRQRVICANCAFVYDRTGEHDACLKCGSNAYNALAGSPQQKKESAPVKPQPRLLHDELDTDGNILLG